jgi:predicted enzyme related to lactoylglutathione lyase
VKLASRFSRTRREPCSRCSRPPESTRCERPPESGDFSWHELATTDYEAAFELYADLFGWQKSEAMGGQVLHGPMVVPGGDMIVTCLDPQGALFTLHSTGKGEGG